MTRHYSADDTERDEAFPPKVACACRVDYDPHRQIVYCPLHQAAGQMREALQLLVKEDELTMGLVPPAFVAPKRFALDKARAALTASQEVPHVH